MFSLGWPEMMLVALVLVIVVGPKQMPVMLRGISRSLGRARRMANEFRDAMMDAADVEGMRDVKSALDDVRDDFAGSMHDIEHGIGGNLMEAAPQKSRVKTKTKAKSKSVGGKKRGAKKNKKAGRA